MTGLRTKKKTQTFILQFNLPTKVFSRNQNIVFSSGQRKTGGEFRFVKHLYREKHRAQWYDVVKVCVCFPAFVVLHN